MPFIMWHAGGGGGGGGVGDGGEGGRQTAVSHQHSVNCSQPVATPLEGSQGQSSRVELKEERGPECLQLEGHPYLFSHIHAAHRASQDCLSSVMYKSVARGERVAAIWEWLCLFLIVSCLFTPTQLRLSRAALLCSLCVGSAPLACSGSKPPM